VPDHLRTTTSRTIVKALAPGRLNFPGSSGTADLRGAARGQMMGATNTSIQGNPAVSMGPGAVPPVTPLGGDPRTSQYRPGWNYPTLPGEGRGVSYDTLRSIAGLDWALRKALDVRINEICSLTMDLVGRDRGRSRKRSAIVDNAARISEIKTFMERPDRRRSFRLWLRRILEDRFVLDAVTLVHERNQDPDAGPLGPDGASKLGGLISLRQIDGATIKVLLDDAGELPLPPSPAYQQFLFGIPRSKFTAQEMTYAPQNGRVFSPYGLSEVEAFLYLVSVNLRYWANVGAKYTDGTLPEGVAEAPENWTPEQLAEYSQFWDSVLAGDPKALRKLIFVPHGFKWHTFADDKFDETLARFLVECICIALDVTPMEMGFEPRHGGLGGKGLGETEERVQERRSLRPTLSWLFGDILNPILTSEWGAPELEWTALELDRRSEAERAKAIDQGVRNATLSIDEAIEEDGGEPIGAGRIFVVGPTLVLGEPDMVTLTEEGASALGLITSPEDKAAAAALTHQNTMDQLTAQAQLRPAPAPGPAGAKPAPTSAPKPAPKPASPASKAAEPTRPASRTPAAPPNPAGEADPGIPPDPGRSHPPSSGNALQLATDLRRWQTKALHAARSGRHADVQFRSEAIEPQVQDLIHAALGQASSTQEVRGAFEDPAVRALVIRRLEHLLAQELSAT
jgi:hypothetical protein